MNDEDVQWGSGRAVDPRVNQFDPSNDNLGWCEQQMKIGDQLLSSLGTRFSEYQDTHDDQRTAFEAALSPYLRCSRVATDYIGGEYLSQAHVGDPDAQTSITGVWRTDSQRAFNILDERLFSDKAWQFSPRMLRELVYTEWVTDFTQFPWQYNPPVRHDEPVATIVEQQQRAVISQIFNPVVLQRIDDFSLKYKPGTTMSLVDLLDWMHHAVFGDLRDGSVAKAGEIHRALQQWFARDLEEMVHKPADGTPYDAQSLAREQLIQLRAEVARARHTSNLDAMTRAHLDALAEVVSGKP